MDGTVDAGMRRLSLDTYRRTSSGLLTSLDHDGGIDSGGRRISSNEQQRLDSMRRLSSRMSLNDALQVLETPMSPDGDRRPSSFESGQIVRSQTAILCHEDVEYNVAAEKKEWYKDAVFYEVYCRAFCDSNGDGHGDIAGLTSKLDYIANLGVDCIWLLPIHPSPLRDDGYDVADYMGIHPTYGNLRDFKVLIDAIHERHMRLIMDFIPNHTSSDHEWFQQARADRNSPYRDYYVWSDDPEKYKGVRIIFTDTHTSNWTYDEVAGQYYWHRFFSSQPDLNFDNPRVQQEILGILKYWLDMGVDGFRVDAVPYLFEREGTSCENLVETHEYLRKMRKFVEDNYGDRLLLSEANMWPEEVREYFGPDGDEFHMCFHFPIMPRIFMSIKRGDASSLVDIINRTPPIPPKCQWVSFLRNHDELTLEMVTEDEREYMWNEYAPERRMRINLGIRRRLAPLLDHDRRKIELAHSLLLTTIGSPIFYYGDEIGMGDNIWLPDRNGVRTPMQWDDSLNAGFSTAPLSKLYCPVVSDGDCTPDKVNVQLALRDPGSLYHVLRRMLDIRRKHVAFGHGQFEFAESSDKAVIAYVRTHGVDQLLIVNNVSGNEVPVSLKLSFELRIPPTDCFTGLATDGFDPKRPSTLSFTVEPYQFLWLDLHGEDRVP